MTTKGPLTEADWERARARANKTAAEWKAIILADGAVEKDVEDRLEQQFDGLIAKILGFDNRWGRWELDHTNGRAGNSFIGAEIRERAEAAAIQVVNEALQDFKPSAALLKEVVAEFKREVLRAAEKEIGRRVEAAAADIVKEATGQ